MHIWLWWANIMERGHFAMLGVDWRINIKMDLKKVGTGFIWLRTGAGVGLPWILDPL
jgi:hypothetical protein